MNQQSNFLIGAGIAFISGVLLTTLNSDNKNLRGTKFGESDSQKCPYCAEVIKKEAVICRFCQKEQPIPSDIADLETEKATQPTVLVTTADFKKEILRLSNNGFSYWVISGDFNESNKLIPETYSQFQKWTPELVKLIVNS